MHTGTKLRTGLPAMVYRICIWTRRPRHGWEFHDTPTATVCTVVSRKCEAAFVPEHYMNSRPIAVGVAIGLQVLSEYFYWFPLPDPDNSHVASSSLSPRT